MQVLSQLVNQYRQLLESGDNLAVIERYYADDIIQIENNEAPTKGKEQILKIEQNNIATVNSFSQKIENLVIDEKQRLVMGEMNISFDSKKYGKKKLNELFIQHWKNEKIIYQKFYYKEILDDNE